MQTVVELFPNIKDIYHACIGFLMPEEKKIAREQIPLWEQELPRLRREVSVMATRALAAQNMHREHPTDQAMDEAVEANRLAYVSEQAYHMARNEIHTLRYLINKTEGMRIRRPISNKEN
jgi:hypothetical protein